MWSLNHQIHSIQVILKCLSTCVAFHADQQSYPPRCFLHLCNTFPYLGTRFWEMGRNCRIFHHECFIDLCTAGLWVNQAAEWWYILYVPVDLVLLWSYGHLLNHQRQGQQKWLVSPQKNPDKKSLLHIWLWSNDFKCGPWLTGEDKKWLSKHPVCSLEVLT